MNPTHLVSVAALVTNDAGDILLVKSPWRGWEYPEGSPGRIRRGDRNHRFCGDLQKYRKGYCKHRLYCTIYRR